MPDSEITVPRRNGTVSVDIVRGDASGAFESDPLNGVGVTGTPTDGQVLTATSATAATWENPTGGGGGGTWGTITGTLSAQTDLADALTAKLASATAATTYQPLAAVLTGTTASFTTADETKLDGVATGATANSADATLLARANHTGTQAHTTITGLGTLATQSGTFSGTSSGTNTGDQTSIVGISGTMAQFNTAITDGDFASLTLVNTKLSSVALTIDSSLIGTFTSIELPSSGTITGNVVGSVLQLATQNLVTNATHTGDATGATALTLATVNSNVGTFALASVTVNAKGLITAASAASTLGTGNVILSAGTINSTAGQTYTLPSTTATIARTDAAQTFTGTQTFSGQLTLPNGATINTSGDGSFRDLIISAGRTLTLRTGVSITSGASGVFTITATTINFPSLTYAATPVTNTGWIPMTVNGVSYKVMVAT